MVSMNPERYRLSFTTGGLFPREAPRVEQMASAVEGLAEYAWTG